MSGHYICDQCGYDGEHADYCAYRRPVGERWRGHLSKEEVQQLAQKNSPAHIHDVLRSDENTALKP